MYVCAGLAPNMMSGPVKSEYGFGLRFRGELGNEISLSLKILHHLINKVKVTSISHITDTYVVTKNI